MEKDKVKEFKETRLIIVLVAIIIVLVFALGFVLGTKHNKILINPDTTKEAKKEEKEKEEIVTDSKPEEDKILETIDDELAKKAYKIIPTSYEIAIPFYRGRKINLTKIDDNLKLYWILNNTLPSSYEIPICSSDRLDISEEDIKKYSLFEDNSFIEQLKNNKDDSNNETVYSYDYSNNKFSVGNGNCDGRGTGPQDFEKFAYDSYKVEKNLLYVTVRFAYFEVDRENSDFENNKELYNIKDSYEKSANTIYKGYEVSDFNFDLDDTNSVLYQFTFKIDGEKLYPLTVEMK